MPRPGGLREITDPGDWRRGERVATAGIALVAVFIALNVIRRGRAPTVHAPVSGAAPMTQGP